MYIPLKVTTDYSLLKSLIKVKDLINFCIEKNITICGICDTNLFGVIKFYKLCKQNHIKPLIGLEISLNNDPVYFYAENEMGYKNLLKINTIISERELTLDEINKYCQNILVILPYESLNLETNFTFVKNLFFSYKTKNELNSLLIKTKNVVYLNDIKAFTKNDLEYLKYLDYLNNQNDKEYIDNYFKIDELDSFDLENSIRISNLLNVEISYNERYIPIYCENSYEFLTNLCIKGLKKRLNNNVPNVYIERLKKELNVIKKMGFVDYFLIVYDYVFYAKKNNILVGPGRGSAAGSLVSYVTGITDIDPLKYDLLFERFLNPERVTMPDIDIDFDNTKREMVIDYVKNKYGQMCVSGGMTFTTLKTRLVLRDVSKILKVDERLLNKFIKVLDKNKNLRNNLNIADVKKYLNNYPELKKTYEISLKLEGLKKNISTHAAGIVIANRPLDEIIPMYKNKDTYLTGVTMEYLEDLGLLKMDFLALKNLSIISDIIKRIPNFDLQKINLEDKLVYDLFQKGKTDGIFQFETNIFKNMLIKYKPQNFRELVASIALVRPGPSRELETYIKRKNGQEKITYYDESLKDILKETYGVIVYQEQVINILVKMASFSYAQADNIRWAMSKKKEEIINAQKEEFIKRSVQNGYSQKLSETVFAAILEFASYGFNKSHSVAYALVSYQMAYLKVHYNPLFNFVLLDNSLGSSELIKKYLSDLKKDNLSIQKVDINYSTNKFELKNKTVILPFKMLKNIKKDLIDNIINERNNGIYLNVFDFFRRTHQFISKEEYVMLIKANALSSLNLSQNELLTNLDSLINYGFLYDDLKELAFEPELEKVAELDINDLRNNELESYGMYITNHPASKYIDKNIMKLENIQKYVFKPVTCYILIENIKKLKTKKNEDMAFISGSDETGSGDFTIFPNKYNLLQNLAKNDMIKIRGNVTKRFDKYSIIINEVWKV